MCPELPSALDRAASRAEVSLPPGWLCRTGKKQLGKNAVCVLWVSTTEQRRQLTKKCRLASRRGLLLSAVRKFTLTEKAVFEQKIKKWVFLQLVKTNYVKTKTWRFNLKETGNN